ncbi:MAG: hypothetical protein V3U71_13975 [Cocleimonas sp.]
MNTSTTTLLKYQQQIIVGILLLLTMILTRGNITAHLQDASWAVFFLVGFYFRGSSFARLGFPLFFLVAFIIDLVVIDAQGGTHYCFTPAYPFLIPAYAAMWFAGHWFAKHYEENVQGTVKFMAAGFVGVAVCFLISNAGFYFFSAKFEEMSVIQYTQSVAQYLPSYLKTTAVYLGFVALVHLAVKHGGKLLGHAHS